MNNTDARVIRNEANILPRPSRTSESCRNLSSWVEEGIWGHRLWHRQTPWLLFLEYLNIAEAEYRQGTLLTSNPEKTVRGYRLHQRIALRNLVFNNTSLSKIAESGMADLAKWEEWIKQMNEESLPSVGQGYSYLRETFPRFSDFNTTVELLRQTVIEPGTNRRWSSRFLFPFGAKALYEDLNISSTGSSREYLNFGRTGELLYLMMSRSAFASDLAPMFKRFFTSETLQTKMVGKLLPPDGTESLSDIRSGGFLPYRQHPAYDRLADDWLAVLGLNLPSYDAFAHLVPLAALHVILYLMETATAWLEKPSPVYICEVIAPRMEFVRQRAIRSYQDNDGLPWAAVERVVNNFMNGSKWNEGVNSPELFSEGERVDAAINLLSEEFWMREEDLIGCGSVGELQVRVFTKLRDKHEDNWSIIHAAYGRQSGLISKRSARNYRYAPTDALLKTLVLANVRKRIEINEFLALLFNKYRFVFGPLEAAKALAPMDYDEPAFQKNRARLEERLRSMGLLNRLSDGCAYVENPVKS